MEPAHHLGQVLDETEAQLEAELRQLPLFRQIEAVREAKRQLASVFGGAFAPAHKSQAVLATQTDAAKLPAEREVPLARPVRAGSTASIVSGAALELFQTTGRRASSKLIMEILQRRGVRLHPTKPQGQIASILSHHPMFNNTGDNHGQGYGLVQWTEDAEKMRTGGAVGPNGTREPAKVAATPTSEVAA